jgi:hypothetical protein
VLREIVDGFATVLSDAGVGVWNPDPNAAYAPGELGIYYGDLSDPDDGIALSVWIVSANIAETVVGLQAMVRRGGADRGPCDDTADAVFDVLHAMEYRALPSGVRIASCLHQAGADLGQDSAQRWARADTYYASVAWPTPNRH